MSELNSWRNPQGREENWHLLGRNEVVDSGCCFYTRLLITELALPFILTIAIVETCFYLALVLLTHLTFLCTASPHILAQHLFSSASFTVLWSITNLIFNLVFPNIFTRECFAREWAEILNPTYITLERPEDRIEAAALRRAALPPLPPPVVPSEAPRNQPPAPAVALTPEEEGAQFIVNEVLNGMGERVVQAFKDFMADDDDDYAIIPFILTKAVFIYVFGSKRKESLPPYFQEQTKQEILTARFIELSQEDLTEITGIINNPKPPVLSANVKYALNALQTIANHEQRNSVFATRCWGRAIQLLPPPATS